MINYFSCVCVCSVKQRWWIILSHTHRRSWTPRGLHFLCSVIPSLISLWRSKWQQTTHEGRCSPTLWTIAHMICRANCAHTYLIAHVLHHCVQTTINAWTRIFKKKHKLLWILMMVDWYVFSSVSSAAGGGTDNSYLIQTLRVSRPWSNQSDNNPVLKVTLRLYVQQICAFCFI